MSVDAASWNEEWRDSNYDDPMPGDGPRYAGGVMMVGDPSDARD